ncbi:MAG: FAD-binding oxidoreductase [Acidobacteria bacterium]|nr:FAD-binding oxidoreductase [Acidobacteriota bacterium]
MSTASASKTIQSELAAIVEADRVLTRPIDLISYASDASFYRLVPRAVVQSRNVEEIRNLFAFSQRAGIPMTFRSAGTSLSGQAVTDGLLIDTARHWRGLWVEDGGRRIRVQPGVIGADANRALSLYGAKIGPDPASIATCTLGGILANNSSGMCCGVEQNAYHTLRSMRFVLPSGVEIDTAADDADERFHALEPALARGVLELRRRLLADAALRERVRSKYRMKNTTGYSLNAFLDFERAVDIFQHVIIGSEGTLAFIAEAVLNTAPDLPVKYTGLLLFSDLASAADSIVPLRDAGAKALEIMDRAALRSVETQAGIPPSIRALPEGAAGLLAEFQSSRESERTDLARLAADATGSLRLHEAARFTHNPVEQALLWKIRSGMFPSVGSVRRSGATVIIEDVAFPVDRLAAAIADLNALFRRHEYPEAIIFGHAKDGNLHFVVTQGFGDQKAIDRYSRFMDDVVGLVVKGYDGALKAEHGTGRNMAPFVETEWGPEGYEIMRRLKALADPHGLLNPGVIINASKRAHLENLKAFPTIEPEVDKCIECGYCEPKCPSRELTLTPRKRIVVRREMKRLAESGADPALAAALAEAYPYQALDTCATDGLCATACPVGIDTGKLVKLLRHSGASEGARRMAVRVASNFALAERGARMALRLGHLGEAIIGSAAINRLARALSGMAWTPDMPQVAGAVPRTSSQGAKAVYFPSCISRIMGRIPGEPDGASVMRTLVDVAERAGAPVHIPPDVAGTCCGTPFSSKGFVEGHDAAANAAIERFWRWSDGASLPVVVDTSPCTYGLKTCRASLTPENQARFDQLRIVDSIEFAHDTLLPALTVKSKAEAVALHPVCSVAKMGLGGKLESVARACASNVIVPPSAGCCGFAGDRGFLFPELTAAATLAEAREVKSTAAECYSSSRTCEIGMTRATGRAYRSYLYLLDKVTR